MTLKKWLRLLGLTSSATPASRKRRQSFRPCFECLEGRLTPAINQWTGANHFFDHDWNDANNWSLNRAPNAGDAVLFTNNASTVFFTSNINVNFTVASITIDSSWGGTINANSNLTVTGNFSLSSGAIGGNGAVSMGGTSCSWNGGTITTGTGGWTVTSTGKLTIDTTGANLTLNGGGTLTNNGIILEAGTNNLFINNGTTLSDSSTATYKFTNNSSITESGGGTFSNAGLLEKTAGTGTSFIQSTFNSTGGTIDSEVGTLSLDTAGGLISGGVSGAVLEAGVGGSTTAVLDLTGGTTVSYTGNFSGSGSGTVALDHGTLAVTNAGAGFNFTSSLFQWSAGTIDVGSGGTLTNTGVMNLNTTSSNVVLNGSAANGGTLANSATINEAGGDNLFIDNHATLNNTATYDFTSDSNITESGVGTFTNASTGLVEKTGGSGTSVILSTFNNNAGTIDSAAANTTLSIDSAGGLINGATLEADANATLDLTGGTTVSYQGAITGTGTGTLALDHGTLAITNAGATFTMGGSLFQWSAGTIDVSSGGTLTNASTSVLNLNTAGANLTLNGAGTLLNNGTINEPGVHTLFIDNTATLTNAGTYDFTADSNITESGGGTFSNPATGLLEKTGGSGTSLIQATFNNTGGTIDAAVATLALDTAGGLINGATLLANGTLDLTGGTTVDYQGTIGGSGSGTIALDHGTLAVTGSGATFTMTGSVFQWSAGTIDVSSGGTLTNAGTSVLNIINASNVVLNGAGTLLNNGTINATVGTLFIDNTATLSNVGTYDFTGDASITESGGGTLSNIGLIEKTGGSGTSVIGSTLNSTNGTIDSAAAGTTLSLDTAGGLIDSTSLEADTNAVLDLTGGTSVDYQGTINGSGAGTIALDHGTLVVTATGLSFNMPAGLFQWSAGTIDVSSGGTLTNPSGSVFNFNASGSNLTVNGAGTLANAGTMNESGGNSVFLDNHAVLSNAATYDFTSDSSITESGGGTLTNTSTGLVEKTGGSSTSFIIATFNNNGGTIDVSAGTLSLDPVSSLINGANLEADGTAVLDLTGGTTVNYQGTISGTGTGTIALDHGTLAVTSSGATFNMPGANLFQWSAGTIDVSSGGTLTNPSTSVLNLNTAGANLTLNGAGTLENDGTINEAGGNSLFIDNTAVLNNTATYDFTANSSVTESGGGTLDNAGTGLIEKTGGMGTSFIISSFNNTGGTIDAVSGTISFDSVNGFINGATLEASGGGAIDLTGGTTVSYQGAIGGSGAGTITLDHGTLAVTASGATFTMSGPNLFQWTAGTIDVSSGGTLTNASTSVMNINTGGSNVVLNGSAALGGTLLNDGTINLSGGNTLFIQNHATLVNAGNFNISGGTAITQSAGGAFSNTGGIGVSGGFVGISASVSQVSGGVLTGGTWFVGPNSTLDITSAGNINTIGSGASVTLDGPNAVFTNMSSSLSAINSGGSLTLLGGESYQGPTGGFTNNGNLTLGPGSNLTAQGPFTEGASANLTLEMGEVGSVTSIGNISSVPFNNTGGVSLAGNLTITSSVIPNGASSFTLVSSSIFGVTGTFAGLPSGSNFTVTVGANTLNFQITYSANAVTIAPRTDTWTGAGANGQWTNPSNWAGGVAPSVGDILLFGPGAARLANTNNFAAGTAFNSIDFTSAGYTLGGASVLLENAVDASHATGANTINVALTLGGPDSIVAGGSSTSLTDGGAIALGASNLTVSGGAGSVVFTKAISGTGGLTDNSSGTVTLQATNSYSGGTTVGAGTLVLDDTTGVAISGPLSTSGLVQLALSNQIATGATVTVSTSGTLDLNGHTNTVAGLILINGSVTTEAGTLTTKSVTDTGTSSFAGNWALPSAGTVTANSSSTLTVSAVISGSASLTMNGSGTVVFHAAAANTYTGGTTVQSGTLQLNDTGGLAIPAGLTIGGGASAARVQMGTTGQILTTIPVNINSGGTLDLNGFSYTVASLVLNNGAVTTGAGTITTKTVSNTGASSIAGHWALPATATITANPGSTLTISAVISGAFGLTEAGTGTLKIQGAAANTYTGTTLDQAGTLLLDNSAGVAIPAGLTVGTVGTSLVQLQASNQISGTATVTVNSLGTFDLNGFNNTIGSLVLSSGTVTTEAGTLSAKTVTDTGTSSIAGHWALPTAATVTVNPSSTLNVSAVISGSGVSLTKAGTGTLSLQGTAANTYGTTTVQSGTLLLDDTGGVAIPAALTIGTTGTSLVQLLASNQIGSTATVVVDSPGTFDLNGQNNTIGALVLNSGTVTTEAGTLSVKSVTDTGTSSIAGNWALPAASTVTVSPSATLNVSAVISGGFGLAKAGGGTLSFQETAANTYTGTTTVQSGTLLLDDTGGVAIPGALTVGTAATSLVQLQASNQIAGSAVVTVDGFGTFDLNGQSNSVLSLVLSSGTVTTGAGTLTTKTINDTGASSFSGNWALPATASITVNPSSTLTIGAAISGAFGLSKGGTGTLVLNGTNSYTGPTTIFGGTLLVNGSQAASAVTVKTGGTLGGSGTVGNVSVNSGGAIQPGTSASSTGTLTTGKVTFVSGSSFNVDLNGTTAGSGYDQVAAGSTVTLGGSTLNVTLGFTPAIGTIFTIIANNSGSAVSGTFNGLAQGATFTQGGMTFQISYLGGVSLHDVTLTRIA
jgi:autotransporter-associated beta strand protein